MLTAVAILAALPERTSEILLWSGVLVVAIVVLFVVTVTVKRRLDATSVMSGHEPPFTLDELRRLRDRGEIDDEQYARARDAIVNLTRGPPPPPESSPESSPGSTSQAGEVESAEEQADNEPDDPSGSDRTS